MNDVDLRIKEIVSTIIGLEELRKNEEGIEILQKEFNTVKNRIEEINSAVEFETKNLRDFFQEKGTNEETIKDSQKASENLSKIISDLENIEILDTRLKATYRENNQTIDNLQSLYDRNNSLIASNLADINSKLQVNNENVLDINFTYEFDDLEYQNSLFIEFYNKFSNYHISGTSESRVKEVLFLIEPNLELLNVNYSTFKERLNNVLEENNIRKQNNYVKIITDIFFST